jgi:voltage-gated potassium channel
MMAERWERRAEVPLLLLAVAFLVAYAWPVLDPRIDPTLRNYCTYVSWTVWGAFAVDFAVRVALAEDRVRYVLRHWYDVAIIALPILRPLRLLRLLSFFRILQRSAAASLAGRVTTYIIGATVMAIGLGAIVILDVEQEAPGANITTFGDALWWAVATATTVGYGDAYPVTTTGRLVAVALMLVGIALVGGVTAAIATWFVADLERGGEK